MSTADASKSAGATGIELRLDGDDFALSAAAAPPIPPPMIAICVRNDASLIGLSSPLNEQ